VKSSAPRAHPPSRPPGHQAGLGLSMLLHANDLGLPDPYMASPSHSKMTAFWRMYRVNTAKYTDLAHLINDVACPWKGAQANRSRAAPGRVGMRGLPAVLRLPTLQRLLTSWPQVTQLRQEVMTNESKFHLLHCQMAITDQQIKKVTHLCGQGQACARTHAQAHSHTYIHARTHTHTYTHTHTCTSTPSLFPPHNTGQQWPHG